MAYIKQGGAKKGVKLALTIGDAATTRTYSGLNFVETGVGGDATKGSTINEAITFFTAALDYLTTATFNRAYSVLEQEYTYQS